MIVYVETFYGRHTTQNQLQLRPIVLLISKWLYIYFIFKRYEKLDL